MQQNSGVIFVVSTVEKELSVFIALFRFEKRLLIL